MWQVRLLAFAGWVTAVSAQSCACNKDNLQLNNGVPQDQSELGQISIDMDPTTCDITVTCSGYQPLTIFDHYSTTIDGASPDGNPDTAAPLAYTEGGTTPGTKGTIQFEYMRCNGQDWVIYMKESDYTVDNSQFPDDPNSWLTYNAISCSRKRKLFLFCE